MKTFINPQTKLQLLSKNIGNWSKQKFLTIEGCTEMEDYISIFEISTSKNLGSVFMDEVGFSWKKRGFPSIKMTPEGVQLFIESLMECDLLRAMVAGNLNIGFTLEKEDSFFNSLCEHGIMENWLNANGIHAYRLNEMSE